MFLCGDVMTGRGIDQIMPYPSDPILYESYVKDARHYVTLAEEVNGSIPRPVEFDYIWGNALPEMLKADVRIINLETSITRSDRPYDKGINYRMHPNNTDLLKVAGVNCCSLANNHVLDWGAEGLLETIKSLGEAGIGYSGAGQNDIEAKEPCILNTNGKGRVLVFSLGLISSGIPREWGASHSTTGINLLTDFSRTSIQAVRINVEKYLHPGDIVVASIHWGGNWGYEISNLFRNLAHNLIDLCHVDVIHGHSSHHVMGIEVYKKRPIIYGCGDFLNDYEGISGKRSFRGDLGLMYFVTTNPETGELESLRLVPTQIKRMQITDPDIKDKNWMYEILNRESRVFSTSFQQAHDKSLVAVW